MHQSKEAKSNESGVGEELQLELASYGTADSKQVRATVRKYKTGNARLE